jgi:ATP-dependent DNA helicase RecQ/Werner syndrome ATP-dependent helicase
MLLRKVRILQLILLPSTFVIFAPSCHCFLLPRQSSIIMADEFGDDNFLDDFDVDTAVLRKRESLSPSARHDQNPYKKPKRSPLRALPFNKRITVGTKVDYPQEIVASEAPDLSVDEYRQEPMLPQTAAKPLLTKALTQTLQKYFGYSNFRSGQLEVIQASLEQRDVGVFWATGSGKSLCYQIPALHTGHIAVVVSPLISLMEDQVHKLNGLSEQPLATFLGSGQVDVSMEDRALDGQFPLVYVTPEKLLSINFLDRLAHLHKNKNRLSVIAIDESHCVSEWGHDFRPEYRKLHLIRSHGGLDDVPIMALTATAIPRVQQDIVTNLALREPHIDRQSFDRDNLQITVQRKKTGGIPANMRPLLSKLADRASTIIYVPTRDQVEEVCSYLQRNLEGVQVEAYHAGMPQDQRILAHTNFLVGKTSIICATVAFGMGIDKPDTRRVLHYGSPKTMEEYYQQIGRAGRDGLPAECLLIVSDVDFDRYRSDFYTGKLSAEAKVIFGTSLDALRNFAMDSQTCRRKSLLTFFEETPKFGDRCGTCDVCLTHKQHLDDLERDLGPMGARVILEAVRSLREQGLSVLEKVIAGNTVEAYRYLQGTNATEVQKSVQDARNSMEKKRPISYFRELLAPMVTKGYLIQKIRNVQVPGQTFSRSYTYYEIAARGREVLADPTMPIMLPVPQSVRDIEIELEDKRQKTLASLETSGVDMRLIPDKEVELGDGDVIRAFTKWHSYLDGLVKAEKHDRIQQMEDLRLRIDAWRLDAASKYRVAPASVMAEHIVVLIAYTVASMKPGQKVEKEALVGAGVRSREIGSLVDSLHEWVDEVQPAPEASTGATASSVIVFDEAPFTPAKAWEYSSYKPKKSTGMATWESSHRRFLAGEHPQAIAMTPENGRPVQVATVIYHILQGLELGYPVPLKKLAAVLPAPTEDEWNELARTEQLTSMSVVGDPDTSGVDGGKFLMTEFLRPIMGDAFLDTPYNLRSSHEKAKFGQWCDALRWYCALKRVGFEPTFE